MGARVETVAQDGDPIADPEHLVQSVRHVDDADPTLGDLLYRGEQDLLFAGRKRGCGLVEHEDLDITHECLRDLGELPIGEGEAADVGLGLHRKALLVEVVLRSRHDPTVADEVEPVVRLTTEKEVGTHRHRGHEA